MSRGPLSDVQSGTHVVLVRKTARFKLGEDQLAVESYLKAACTNPRKQEIGSAHRAGPRCGRIYLNQCCQSKSSLRGFSPSLPTKPHTSASRNSAFTTRASSS